MPNGKSHIDGLVQERGNSSALAMELSLSCRNPSILDWKIVMNQHVENNCGVTNDRTSIWDAVLFIFTFQRINNRKPDGFDYVGFDMSQDGFFSGSMDKISIFKDKLYINWLVQERRNSNANALELCLSCSNPSIYT